MTQKIILIPADFCNYIQGLQYEVEARQSLLNFILTHSSSFTDEIFKRYHDEYVNFYAQYQISREQLVERYIKPLNIKWKDWSLDFNTEELYINYNTEDNLNASS